jgi:diketogulonate reductase-like aldo/keto reductase
MAQKSLAAQMDPAEGSRDIVDRELARHANDGESRKKGTSRSRSGRASPSQESGQNTELSPQSTITLNSGRKMPVLGLGTWQLSNDTAGNVEAALRLGYRMIDTSGDYGTQPGIGEAIKRSGLERERLYLVTKVEETDDAYQATRKNLDELQVAYADLMLIHRPPDTGPGEELWRGLMRAKQEGLARDIGVSNYSIELLDALTDATGEVPSVNQIEWSPFGRSDAMEAYCREHKIIIQAYSPLTRTRRLGDDSLKAIASKYGKTPAQVIIRWNLQRGTVPLPKANSRHHQQEDLAVFDFEISPDDMAAIDGLNERYSSLGSLPYA